MTRASTLHLLHEARAANRGIGAFNVLHLETLEALIAGAEDAGLPVILQISENCVKYHGSLKPLAVATVAAAEQATVPVAVHLDHAEDVHLARQAVDLGFSSVMYDGAALAYSDNVTTTAGVVEYAHASGASVEAELGEIGGKDGAHAPGVRTDPQEAAQFVGETGVDSLAVAVGSSHAMQERTAQLDLDLIARIHERVDVPLVLHGSSGVGDASLVAAIGAGMTKINVSTHLNGFFTRNVRAALENDANMVDSRKYLGAGRSGLIPEVTRLLRLFAEGMA